MRPVVWTALARQDLREQVACIAADSPRAAARVRDRVDEVAQNLSQFATGRRGRVAGTYEQVVTDLPYFIVYRIRRIEGVESVRILHLVHTSRKWPQ